MRWILIFSVFLAALTAFSAESAKRNSFQSGKYFLDGDWRTAEGKGGRYNGEIRFYRSAWHIPDLKINDVHIRVSC